MRLLEQLECTPPVGLSQHNAEDPCSEEPSPMEADPAPLWPTGLESAFKDVKSQQEPAAAHSKSQHGSRLTNDSFSGCSQNGKEGPGDICSQQSSDIAAMAALTVQVFTRQMHFRPAADTGYWRSQVPAVPAAAQQFALACLAVRPASMRKVIRDSFFTAEVRAAADYLARMGASVSNHEKAAGTHEQLRNSEQQLQTVSGYACTLQAMLDGPLDLKALAKRGALRLCTHSIVRVIADAARRDSSSSASASTSQQVLSTDALVAEVLLRLIVLLPRSLAIQGPLRVWAALLGGQAPCDLPISPGEADARAGVQAQLMQPDRLRQLVASVGLSAYMDTVHGALLSAVCGGAPHAGEPAGAHSTQHAIQVCTGLLK